MKYLIWFGSLVGILFVLSFLTACSKPTEPAKPAKYKAIPETTYLVNIIEPQNSCDFVPRVNGSASYWFGTQDSYDSGYVIICYAAICTSIIGLPRILNDTLIVTKDTMWEPQ